MEKTKIGNTERSYDELLKHSAVRFLPDGRHPQLSAFPHQKMEDMALVFTDSFGHLVTNRNLQELGISMKQFQEDALAAASENHPVQLTTIEEALGMPADILPEKDPGEPQLYVASNDRMQLGAGVLAYPGFLDQAAERLGGDFYVLPSSIHEVLLLPDHQDMTIADLNGIVRSVNAQEVAPEERLSDHVYHYDSREKVFELAEKFEARQQEKATRPREKESVLKSLKEEKQRSAARAPEHRAKPAVKAAREEVL